MVAMAGRGPRPRIYTVGHSNRSLEDLVALLRQAGIQVLVDVRRFPGSRRWPWFQREALQAGVEAAGIRYVWLGKVLGGYTRPPYPDYTTTARFQEGLEALEQWAREAPVAILCAEKDWRHCHRRFIAQALSQRGWEVVHLLDESHREVHPPNLPLDSEG